MPSDHTSMDHGCSLRDMSVYYCDEYPTMLRMRLSVYSRISGGRYSGVVTSTELATFEKSKLVPKSMILTELTIPL